MWHFRAPPAQPREVKVDVSGAPPSVRALVDALATSSYQVDLGEFLLRGSPRPLVSLAAAIDAGRDGAEIDDLAAFLLEAGPERAPLDPACSVLLEPDRGGASALGIGWSGERVFGVIVEIADATPDNLVRAFATPAALFDRLDHVNRRRGAIADVEALRTASGR